ncbi:MAG: hypothetical protein A3D31_09350 [Candidatus Fluviicola riflensis]|nr:MAG: hypothetical protein CHH17_13760 [Candidatus Fluviicola riflensis]OGS77213.1 MAG: hypothetical protein A3D31_09350 [Candidatus Fluviicola riflensis]OGS82148.1 MAG: hypothetical protein A2724_18295 [Fluviicola sp. RIFCSPHIGHO2_01_FULL_43_53]OGS87842.1 MAG: hypothetical protein A3E30_15730 [Fluviicola sp. RIFCSPHIGHO2_12_FULL_43_24]
MKSKSWMKPLRMIAVIGLFFVSASFQRDQVISGDLAFLIGEYDFICSFNNGTKIEPSEVPDKYTLKITKKSEMIVYKNGKKLDKYEFSNTQLPVLDEYEYVMFNKKEQNYPLFYKGDTVVMHISPIEYNDNYFRKRK